MRPVSARFLSTLTGSHTAVFRARVVAPGQTGVDPAGTEVPILDGDVRLDGGAAIRSTVELSVDGTGLWPTQSTSLLTPYGPELFLERGVAYGGGTTEWVSLGYHRINDVDQDDAPDGPIRLVGADRMSMILDAKLTSPRQFPATAQFGAVVEQLVTDAYGAAVIEWDDDAVAGDTIGRAVIAEEDRYKFLDELVVSLGKIWHFDYRGVLVIRTPPQPGRPVWTVSRGKGGVLVSVSRSLSRTGVYNGVVATGEALDTAPPVRGMAVDADPISPTEWGGPFGKVPREYSSPLLKTTLQAQLAAATILRRSLGLPYNVDLTAVPNPALEPDDPVAVGIEGAPVATPPVLVSGDSFSRTVVDGVGTSESGWIWFLTAGTDTTWQVADGVLKKELAAHTVNTAIQGSTPGRPDVLLRAQFRAPVAATGAALVTGFVLRWSAINEFASARIEFNPGGTMTLKLARHSALHGNVEMATLVDFADYTAGEWWTCEAQVTGAGDYLIRAWPTAGTAPSGWYLAGRDTVMVGRRYGLYFWRVIGNTNAVAPQYEVDNFQAYQVPAQALVGGEIHVIDTLNIPLTADGEMSATTREQSLVAIEVE
jgi:hypothetical protein